MSKISEVEINAMSKEQNYLKGYLDRKSDTFKELKQLKEQAQWIPVSERLPKEKGLYLVSVKNEHDRRYSKTCWFHGNGNWFARQDVIAWMPLPESYQESEDSE